MPHPVIQQSRWTDICGTYGRMTLKVSSVYEDMIDGGPPILE